MRRDLKSYGALLVALCATGAQADSKLLATSGGQQFEGQAGGGIVPWALIAGYGDVGEWGSSAAVTQLRVDDLELIVTGASVGYGNRFELSAARQRLRVQPLNLEIDQDVLGAKVRVAGDAIYGSVPAITAGLQWKKNQDPAVPYALGASDDEGLDVTVSAAKLWLDAVAGRNVFANLTVRNTEANETGFLGFGAQGSQREWVAEASAGIFLDRHWVLGLEYRDKPDQLASVTEDAWWDAFVGWFPTKRVSVITAYAELGSVAGLVDQRGFYVSLQLTL